MIRRLTVVVVIVVVVVVIIVVDAFEDGRWKMVC